MLPILQFRLTKQDFLNLIQEYRINKKFYYLYLTVHGPKCIYIEDICTNDAMIPVSLSLKTYNKLNLYFKSNNYIDSCYLMYKRKYCVDPEFTHFMKLVTKLSSDCIQLPVCWNEIFFKIDNKYIICNGTDYKLSEYPIVGASPVIGYGTNYE